MCFALPRTSLIDCYCYGVSLFDFRVCEYNYFNIIFSWEMNEGVLSNLFFLGECLTGGLVQIEFTIFSGIWIFISVHACLCPSLSKKVKEFIGIIKDSITCVLLLCINIGYSNNLQLNYS